MNEAAKTLDLLDGIKRVPAPTGLAEGVMRSLSPARRSPAALISRELGFAIAGILALVALNIYALTGSAPHMRTVSSLRTAAADSLALDYGLTANEYQDLE